MSEKRSEIRRKIHTRYDRRCIERREKTFYYPRKLYLGDTQAMGGSVYYAQYWDLIGEAREEFLKYLLRNDMASLTAFLVTVDCQGKYKHSLFAFDEIRIEVTVKKMSRAKIVLNFRIIKQDRSIAFEAMMTIATVRNGKPVEIPDEISAPIKKHFL